MTPLEELDQILILIKKYGLPLSPILEYAIGEKKEEFAEDTKEDNLQCVFDEADFVASLHEPEPSSNSDEGEIMLTEELIEAARTPNGGFTKSQLAAIGVAWPPPPDWKEDRIGMKVSKQQFEDFNHIEYVVKPPKSSVLSKGSRTYKDVANNPEEKRRMEAVIKALEHFIVPATPRDITRTISRSLWGSGSIKEDYVDTILKRLPEVEYVKCGTYILKSNDL